MPLLEIAKLLRLMFQILDFKWQVFENKHTKNLKPAKSERTLNVSS